MKPEFNIVINLSKSSEKFLKKNSNLIKEGDVFDLVVKAIKKLNNISVNVDLKRLQRPYENYFRIRKGNIRIIFNYENDIIYIANVIKIDFRGKVY